ADAIKLFKDGKFAIVRKTPDVILAMRRLVYDNDHPARDLPGDEYKRWVAADGWAEGKENDFQADPSGEDVSWLRYRHVLRKSPNEPQLITDFMGYNQGLGHRVPGENWASDLILECKVQVQSAEGAFLLEVSKGPDRYRARFDVATGKCTLF